MSKKKDSKPKTVAQILMESPAWRKTYRPPEPGKDRYIIGMASPALVKKCREGAKKRQEDKPE